MSIDRTTAYSMTRIERRAAISLSSIYALRMLGLFMILPVFALYAEELSGVTPTLVGLAIGVYGLTQAMFQIPFGFASDRFGRKPVIIVGLLIFALGSVVAAMADSIGGVILGRALQGCGAIAAAVMALAADLSREEHRTRMMAMIGMSIGASFALALVLGPLLDAWIGVPGIFWLTAVLALLAIAVVQFIVPRPVRSKVHRDAEPIASQLLTVLRDVQLVRLDMGIFILHTILTATFVVLPLVLRDMGGLPSIDHWKIYLPALVLSIAAMLPFIILGERHRRLKQVFIGAILVLGLAELGLFAFTDSLTGIFIAVVVFFSAFNLLEATLPSLVSKMAPPDKKGSAMGVYSSAQFLGAFVGGSAGGWLHGLYGPTGVFAFCALMAGLWALIAESMRSPRYLTSYLVNVGKVDDAEAQRLAVHLTQVTGVAEAVVIADDGVAYLKVDKRALDMPALEKFSAEEA